MEAELDAQIQQAFLLRSQQEERFNPLSASESPEAESGAPLGETAAESAPIIAKKEEKAQAKVAAKEAQAEAKAAKKKKKNNKQKGVVSPMEGADGAAVEEVQLNPLAEPSSAAPNLQHSHAAFESEVEVFDT